MRSSARAIPPQCSFAPTRLSLRSPFSCQCSLTSFLPHRRPLSTPSAPFQSPFAPPKGMPPDRACTEATRLTPSSLSSTAITQNRPPNPPFEPKNRVGAQAFYVRSEPFESRYVPCHHLHRIRQLIESYVPFPLPPIDSDPRRHHRSYAPLPVASRLPSILDSARPPRLQTPSPTSATTRRSTRPPRPRPTTCTSGSSSATAARP